MTRGEFDTAKGIINSIDFLEKIDDVLTNGEDVRFRITYFNKNNDGLRELDMSYLDKDSAEAIKKAISQVIENRLKVYETRLEEL